MTSPQRFPLAWPAHRPRRDHWRRQNGAYRSDGRAITMAVAVDRLDDELRKLGAQHALLSTNVELRLDGRPRSGQRAPEDSGACIYFGLKGKPVALACDTFSTVEQNVAALAAHVESVRKQERLGVATAAESLQAFIALPAGRGWREILDLVGAGTREQVETAYRRLAAVHHPDRGGDPARMAEINAARDAALRELKS